MKKSHQWMMSAFLLVSAALIAAVLNARQNPLYQLAHYRQTPAFKNYVADVSRQMKTSDTGTILNISEPREGKFDDVLEYKINADGKFDLNIRGFALGSGGQSRGGILDARRLIQVKKLIAQLPPSMPPARREDLLVVFLYPPGAAQLRLYDHRHPPLAVRQIVGILDDNVENWIDQLPAEQQPSSPFFPHFQSSLRPKSSNAQRAVD